MIHVEYLLPFDTKDGICKDTSSLKNLISSNSNFKFSGDKLFYKKSAYGYTIDMSRVKGQTYTVFHLRLSTKKATTKYRDMLKSLRKTIGPCLQDNIQIVWDGLSFEWSKEVYPLIYRVENTMRKLISKFMLVTLGISWHKSSIPKDVEESIKTKDFKPSISILYEVDFIQLSNFLFKPYTIKDTSKLPQVIKELLEKSATIETIKSSIQEYLPKNNWDRYFSKNIDVESGELKKKWEKLYDIRCKVAHNKILSIDDYNDAKLLTKELEQALEKALEKIPKIKIPEKHKESISLQSIATVSPTPVTSVYVNNYLKLNDDLSHLVASWKEAPPFVVSDSNLIKGFVDSSNLGQIVLPDHLKDNFCTIETFKNNILKGDFIPPMVTGVSINSIFSGALDNFQDTFQVDPATGLFKNSEINSYFHPDIIISPPDKRKPDENEVKKED